MDLRWTSTAWTETRDEREGLTGDASFMQGSLLMYDSTREIIFACRQAQMKFVHGVTQCEAVNSKTKSKTEKTHNMLETSSVPMAIVQSRQHRFTTPAPNSPTHGHRL